MVAATILLSLAAATFIWGIVISIISNKYRLLGLGLIMSGILSFVGICILCVTPTNKDVREGNAHYIEQSHIKIVNGDTIYNYKTYQIVWDQNTK